MFRLRNTVRSKGGFYGEMADGLGGLSEESGGPILAKAMRTLSSVILSARKNKLTKSQHVMFLMADMMTWAEVGCALCHKAVVRTEGQNRSPDFLKAAARLFAREAVEKIYVNGLKIVSGCERRIDETAEELNYLNLGHALRTGSETWILLQGNW